MLLSLVTFDVYLNRLGGEGPVIVVNVFPVLLLQVLHFVLNLVHGSRKPAIFHSFGNSFIYLGVSRCPVHFIEDGLIAPNV